MRWNEVVFHCLDHLKSDGAEWNEVVWPLYFFPSNLGGMKNLACFVLKFPNY